MTTAAVHPETPSDALADDIDRMGPALWEAQLRLKDAHRDVTTARESMITAARTRADLVREMRTVHGWSYRRIADYLGVSHNALVQSAHVSVSGSDGDAS